MRPSATTRILGKGIATLLIHGDPIWYSRGPSPRITRAVSVAARTDGTEGRHACNRTGCFCCRARKCLETDDGAGLEMTRCHFVAPLYVKTGTSEIVSNLKPCSQSLEH